MTKPIIRAKAEDNQLIVSDEFQWGFLGRHALSWRILEINEEGLLALSVGTVAELSYEDSAAWMDEVLVPDILSCADVQTFLLSADEVARFLPQDATRVAEGNNGNWWLRDAGEAEGCQAYVHNNGWINVYGAESNSNYAALRPAVKIPLDQVSFELPGVDGEESSILNAPELLQDMTVNFASEYGEELMLEALEMDDVFQLEEFVNWFGLHESWETMMVDALTQLAAKGDSLEATRLLSMCGGIEFMGQALAEAMKAGHVAMAGTLLRAGASLDGSLTKAVRLACDTPELRRMRKAGYPGETDLCDGIIASEEGFYSISSLIRQGLISGRNYHALLRAAGKNEYAEDLFEWMLCPDRKPLNRMCVHLVKKRVTVVDHQQSGCHPVSEWALQMLWYPKLAQENPETVHAMAKYLTNPKMEGRRELICFLATQGTQQELQTVLSGKKVFSPKDIAAAIEAAQTEGKTKNAAFLGEFLRSIGAGKLLQKD